MNPYTAVVRAGDGREQYIRFEAATRDEALFETGRFVGKNYSGPWELVKLEEGCGW